MRSAPRLSHRQQQIMAVLDSLGEATAAEIIEAMPDEISNSAIRTHLRMLERKGLVGYREDGPRFVFSAMQPRNSAAVSALDQVIETFFGGSVERTVTMLLSKSDLELSDEELDRLAESIEQARTREAGKEAKR